MSQRLFLRQAKRLDRPILEAAYVRLRLQMKSIDVSFKRAAWQRNRNEEAARKLEIQLRKAIQDDVAANPKTFRNGARIE